MNCDRRKTAKLATAIVLSSAFCVACCGSRKATQTAETLAPPADTIEQFTPLHPPVVVPHDWRDELKDTKQPSATEENN
jgi:hypothetical protein